MADYDHSRIVSFNSENDKNTSFQLGVYMGHPSITVWSNRSQIVRFATPRSYLVLMKQFLRKALDGKPGESDAVIFTKWDQDTKKSVQLGVLYVGRDDKAVIYIGLQAQGHAAIKFPLKTPMSFDTKEPMSDRRKSELMAETLIEQLTYDIPMAISITSFKRTDMPARSGSSSNSNESSSFSF